MVWYLVPSPNPELLVAVGWEPVLGSYIGRVEGVPTGALLDPDHPTVAWFGSRQGELQTVQDLQNALGEYAGLPSDIRAALEADRTGRPDQPPAGPGRPQLVGGQHFHSAQESQSPEPSTGRALLELALMVGLLVVIVVLIVALITILAGIPNL
jgi:hypothetical protein